jgi:putative alpha-1,2-mannosidase
VNLPNGKQFTVIAEGTSAASKYVQNVTLNGQGLGRSHITYAELMAGGELRFTMGAQPAGR